MRISDWSSDLCSSDLIGPHGLGLLGNTENIMALAEIGIVLLLFIIGLELHPSRLMRLRRDIFGLGLAQVVVSGILLAAGIRSEEHTSELQSLMRISYAVFCLKKNK